MAKKLISVWLSLTILIFSPISIYADEVIQGGFFLKNIVINGENIVNYKLSNPLILHKDRIYIPMDTTMGSILGFEAEMDNESRTLKILKTDHAQASVADIIGNDVNNNLDNIDVTVKDIKLAAYTGAQNKDACLNEKQADAAASDQNIEALSVLSRVFGSISIFEDFNYTEQLTSAVAEQCIGEIMVPELAVVQIDLKGQPVLVRNEIVYVPLNAIVSSEALGWSLYYDDYSGIYISTDDEIDAASYFNAETSRYYKALSAYIVEHNPKLKMSQALEMVEYFEAYGQIYGVDLKLLMGMAKNESRFTPDICNSSNCCGIMQIKVSTGNSYGFSKAQLLQVKPNIQMGALYISGCFETFEGDQIKALAAYNCGNYAVKKGNYTTKYADRVLKYAAEIESFVNSYSM